MAVHRLARLRFPSHMHAISVLSDMGVVEAAVALGSSENGDCGGRGEREELC